MSKAPDDREGKLKAAGLAARRDEEWRNLRRVSLQAMVFHDPALAHHDHYGWEDTEDPFEQLKAAAPPEIRRIAELDHCRRTRKEQAELNQWVENVGVKLAAKLGLQRR